MNLTPVHILHLLLIIVFVLKFDLGLVAFMSVNKIQIIFNVGCSTSEFLALVANRNEIVMNIIHEVNQCFLS